MNCKLILPAAAMLACWSFILLASSPSAAQEASPSAFQLRALQAAASQPSVYELSFITTTPLSSLAEFFLEFPPGFDLSKAKIASSDQLPGGFTVVADQQRLRLSRSGRGPAVAAGTAITLRLSAIVNPPDLNETHRVRLQMRSQRAAPLVPLALQPVTFERAEETHN